MSLEETMPEVTETASAPDTAPVGLEPSEAGDAAAPDGPTFAELGLAPALAAHLATLGYTQPTPIQARTIPVLLTGRDVLGQAQTGTGKTAAYGLPLLQRLDPRAGHIQALVLVPTRELALQVVAALHELSPPGRPPAIAAVYGGEPIGKQIRQLDQGVAVVVATPGRLLDHLERGTVDLSSLQLCVLDEADEMLDMGFLPDVESILERAPKSRQTALLSATLAGEIATLAGQILRDPERITVVSQIKSNENVEQRYVVVPPHGRAEAVARILDVEVFESALVFARTKLGCDELTEALQQRGVPCEALHGDLAQPAREAVIRRLRDGRLRVVVATDVAARGLDVPSLDLVVTVELPGQSETYVHRIGRTGRAGRSGKSILVLGPRDERRLRNLERFLGSRLTWQAVPTPYEIAEVRRARFAEQVVSLAKSSDMAPFVAVVEQMLSGEDAPTPLALAAALCKLAAPQPVVEAVLRPPPHQPPEQPPRSLEPPAKPAPAARSGAPAAAERAAVRATPAAEPPATPAVAAAPAAPKAAKVKATSQPAPAQPAAAGGFEPPPPPLSRPGRLPAEAPERSGGFGAISVGVGGRNGVTPAMLVAVLARSLEIPGKSLGRIEIRDNYSLVEVPMALMPEVPTRLHGVLVCGRFLNPRPAREVLEREALQRRSTRQGRPE